MSNIINEAICFAPSNESTQVSGPVPLPTSKTPSAIVEGILGEVDWMTLTEGYCDCPGRSRHSNKSGHRDCAVYLDHIPTLYCVHQSCSTVIETTNKKLRAAILNGEPAETRRLSSEDKARLKLRDDQQRIRLRAACSLPQLLNEFAWPYTQIINDSPTPITGNEPEHWKMLLQKFKLDDVIWIGNTYSSGEPKYEACFRTAKEWLTFSTPPGPFTCPATFKNTSYARSNDNLVERRFLVVESDTLTRNEVGAVFRWLKLGCEMELVAIVDTGGKSLHGWFKFDADVFDDLKLVLPAIQCDPKLFTASQPVRLPSVLRDGIAGKYQKLVYLTKEQAYE